jgi:Zn-dependent protease
LWRARAPKEKPRRIVTKPSLYYRHKNSPNLGTQRYRKIFWFSTTELKHLGGGTLLVMSVALSLFFFSRSQDVSPIILAVVFTTSFLLHEIAHKLTAQHYGAWAEFRLNLFGTLITLISIISPVKIISPGAVTIAGPMSSETIGKTAIAGPLTNILLATLFTVLACGPSPLQPVAATGALINAIIALFNLVPFGIMDGLKIFWWNKRIWAAAFVASIVLTVLALNNLQMF